MKQLVEQYHENDVYLDHQLYEIVHFYKDRVGEEFEATISWVLAKWFFVALSDTSEWFVELKNSQYIEWLQEHHDLSNWNKYRLADKINVKLVEADETMFRLNFEIVCDEK